ncbi:MJ1244 family protein [Methanobacterium ferruginis]|uniref:MJ1244 family protein n=1 Tax=Methanobacterium ferruginis TaxID=710191 RepID=UPI003305687D
MLKVHLRVFVEVENLGKAMNALVDAGITGFYVLEYKGMSPQDWKGFAIKEDPKSAISLIRDYATDAMLICSVVEEERTDEIVESVMKALEGEKYTILEVPIRRIIVNYKSEVQERAETWLMEKKVPCFYCGENAVQRIRIDMNKAKIWCTNCGAARYYLIKGVEKEEN